MGESDGCIQPVYWLLLPLCRAWWDSLSKAWVPGHCPGSHKPPHVMSDMPLAEPSSSAWTSPRPNSEQSPLPALPASGMLPPSPS